MKKIYLQPYIEFEEIEEELLYTPSVESEGTTPENKTQGPEGGEEIGDGSEFDW